jgi:3-oxoadipate enol-lactonase
VQAERAEHPTLNHALEIEPVAFVEPGGLVESAGSPNSRKPLVAGFPVRGRTATQFRPWALQRFAEAPSILSRESRGMRISTTTPRPEPGRCRPGHPRRQEDKARRQKATAADELSYQASHDPPTPGNGDPPVRYDASPTPLPALLVLLALLLVSPWPAWGQAGPFQETEGFVPVEGGSLFYKEAGEGPAVILIHGGYLDHRMWDGQVQPLARHFRVVRYDVRSHGQSSADTVPFSDMEDLAALMDHLEIPRATVVGLSMGGQIAIDFALLWPERVDNLVLVSSGISGGAFDSLELGAYIEALQEAVARSDFADMIEAFTQYWCDGPYRSPDAVDPTVRSKVLEMLGGSLERWRHNAYVEVLDPPAWDRVSSILARTLVIVGTVDMPDILDIAEHLVTLVPDARRVDIQGVAHMVNMEAPDRFNEVVLEFLGRGVPEAGRYRTLRRAR